MGHTIGYGISLVALRELAGRSEDGTSTTTVVNSIIRPKTASKACSYVELLPDGDRGVPNVVVVHAWTASFRALVDMLAQVHPEDTASPTYFWIDAFSCNLNETPMGDRLESASVTPTANSQTDIDSTLLLGPPPTALTSYREAIRTVATPTQPNAPPPGVLALALDPNAAVLTSPWCLYGIWQFLNASRTATPSSQLQSIAPLCPTGLDLMLVHALWEDLSLLQNGPPSLPDSLLALILEEVAAVEPLLAPSRKAVEAPLAGGGAGEGAAEGGAEDVPVPSGGQGPVGKGSGEAGDLEADVEARISRADAAVKHAVLASLEQRAQTLAAAVAASSVTKVATVSGPPEAKLPVGADGGAAVPAVAGADGPAAEAHLVSVASTAAAPAPGDGEGTAVVAAAAAVAPDQHEAPEATAAEDGKALAPPSADAAPRVGAAVHEEHSDTTAAPAETPEPPFVAATVAADTAAAVQRLRAAAAAAADAYGCLAWAAGRTQDSEVFLRRARQMYDEGAADAAVTAPSPAAALVALHLGALLAATRSSQGATGEEAEALLRSALAQLEAVHGGLGAGKAGGEGGGGGGQEGSGGSTGGGMPPPQAAALLAAHARYFLALLLVRRAADVGAGAGGGGSRTAPPGSGGGSKDGEVRVLYGNACLQLPPAYGGGATGQEVAALLAAALPVLEGAYGSEQPLLTEVMSGLAMALKDQGRVLEAEPLLRRALSLRLACSGPDQLGSMRLMNNLAGLLEDVGQLGEAEVLLRRAAELAASSLGPNQPYTAIALSNLGVALRKAGKLDEAEELFRAALEIREVLLGPLALDTAASLTDLTAALLAGGRLAEAEPLFRRILDIREAVLGPSHPLTAASLRELAGLLAQLGRGVDAEPLLRRSVSIHVRVLGPGHEDTATAERELGVLLAAGGAAAEAERLLRRAMTVLETVQGPAHPETIITVNQLAMLLRDVGQETEAEELFRRVLLATEALLEPLEPAATPTDTPSEATLQGPYRSRLCAAALIAVRCLAELASGGGGGGEGDESRLQEAEVLWCRALVGAEAALGGGHPVTVSCAEGLAGVLRAQGLLEDACELYARLVEGLAGEVGPTSPQVAKYLALFEEVYTQRMDQEQQAVRELEERQAAEEDEDEPTREAEAEAESGAMKHARGRQMEAQHDGASAAATVGGSEAEAEAGAATAVRGAAGARAGLAGAPSRRTITNMMTNLMSPFGRSLTVKQSHRHPTQQQQQQQQQRISGKGTTDGNAHVGTVSRGRSAASMRHSFTSFVNRRSSYRTASEGVLGRFDSVVLRVHSALVGTGRINSTDDAAAVAIAGGGGVKRIHLAGGATGGERDGVAVAATDLPYNDAPAAAAADPSVAAERDSMREGAVSPGLPRMSTDAEVGGTGNVSLDVPPPLPALAASGGVQRGAVVVIVGGSSNGAHPDLKATPPRNSVSFGTAGIRRASAPATVLQTAESGESVYGGRSAGEAARRSAMGAISGRRSMSRKKMVTGMSKKKMLAEAAYDLDDEEEDVKPNKEGFGSADGQKAQVPPAAPALTWGPGIHGRPDDEEESVSVGCCGFGGSKRRPAKVQPR